MADDAGAGADPEMMAKLMAALGKGGEGGEGGGMDMAALQAMMGGMGGMGGGGGPEAEERRKAQENQQAAMAKNAGETDGGDDTRTPAPLTPLLLSGTDCQGEEPVSWETFSLMGKVIKIITNS